MTDQAHSRTEPSLPEQARTALARATIATLVTTDCATRSRAVTVVTIDDQPDGRPLVRLEGSSPAIRQLVACPVATLSGRLVGASTTVLALGEFHAARPDPLAEVAADLLDHLRTAHAAELAALCPEGVHRVRLVFPDGPVETLDQVTTGVLVPLTCHCHGTDHP